MSSVRDWGEELKGVLGLDPEALAMAQGKLTSSRARSIAAAPGRSARTGSRVRELRLMRGHSQIRLAMIVGTTVGTIRKAERGYLAQLRVTTVLRIANALDVGAADIFPILAGRIRVAKKAAKGR